MLWHLVFNVMALKTLLTESSWQNDVERLIKKIEEHLTVELLDITDEYEYISSGAWASVYKSKQHPDKVIRVQKNIPPSASFQNNFEKIVGKDFDNVVKVYMHRQLWFGGQTFLVTVMEALEHIDYDIYELLDTIIDDHRSQYGHESTPYRAPNYPDYEQHKEEIDNILQDVHKGFEQLNSVGIDYSDFHEKNVMFDPETYNYKLIDV